MNKWLFQTADISFKIKTLIPKLQHDKQKFICMKRLAIIGSGALGQQIAYHAVADKHYNVVGYFDDFHPIGTRINDVPVIGNTSEIVDTYKQGAFDLIMNGIGYNHFEKRASFFDKYSQAIPFGTIIHSSSFVDKSSKIGSGVFIYPGCTVDMNCVIEDNVLINVGCVVAHDSKIKKHSFLSPGVKIAGFVEIGTSVWLGIGTIVIDNIKISERTQTGAGAVVVNNIAASGLYIGLPAKLKKYDTI